MSPLSGACVGVTGATGFLGLHLTRQLRAAGAEVVALVRDPARAAQLRVTIQVVSLDDPVGLAAALAGCDYVFHLAGAVDFRDDWERFRQVNVDGTRHVVAAARTAGVRRVVHVSSIVAVGANVRPIPLDESAHWNLGRLQVPYVTTKRQAEEAALGANGGHLEVVAVNPSCVIGPDDFTRSEFGTLCRRFWKGRVPVYFRGGGNFVDVRDAADGMIRAACFGRPGERYLLAGHDRSHGAFFTDLARVSPKWLPRLQLPRALAHAAAELDTRFGKPGRPLLSRGQARMIGLFFYFSAAKARAELGWQPRPWADTLRDTYGFWQQPQEAA